MSSGSAREVVVDPASSAREVARALETEADGPFGPRLLMDVASHPHADVGTLAAVTTVWMETGYPERAALAVGPALARLGQVAGVSGLSRYWAIVDAHARSVRACRHSSVGYLHTAVTNPWVSPDTDPAVLHEIAAVYLPGWAERDSYLTRTTAPDRVGARRAVFVDQDAAGAGRWRGNAAFGLPLLLRHPRVGEATLRLIAEVVWAERAACGDDPCRPDRRFTAALSGVLRHPVCPADLLARGCYDTDGEVREAAAGHPATPEGDAVAAALLGVSR